MGITCPLHRFGAVLMTTGWWRPVSYMTKIFVYCIHKWEQHLHICCNRSATVMHYDWDFYLWLLSKWMHLTSPLFIKLLLLAVSHRHSFTCLLFSHFNTLKDISTKQDLLWCSHSCAYNTCNSHQLVVQMTVYLLGHYCSCSVLLSLFSLSFCSSPFLN